MNAPPPSHQPPPASLQRRELGESGLDARIRQVEQRLILREENLRRGAGAWLASLRDTLQPRRLWKPVLGGALAVMLAGLALGLLWRRLPAGRRHAFDGREAEHHDRRHRGDEHPARRALPWAHMVGVVWPMLPARWRARVDPATANALLTVVLPLFGWLMARRRH